MSDHGNYLMNISVLYRNTQKYFDKVLVPYEIGSGQLILLLAINENEGITMQEVTRITEVDKGTTTKSVQRLIDQGYVQSRQDQNDKRVKRLYTTEKANGIMNEIYEYRNRLRAILAEGVDFREFENALDRVCENTRKAMPEDEDFTSLRIGGMQKMTLLDYPGKVACTVFMAGCSYKCPYCHNKDLVFIPEDCYYLRPEEIFSYLEKRKGILDAVCISGGEALLQNNLLPFIRKIKEMGYLVKLDTNGGFPDRLKALVESGCLDYVAMDIKNTEEKYPMTLGLDPAAFSFEPVRESMEYLKQGKVEYEFRTTVVREFHTMEDLIEVAKMIGDVPHYYLQQFTDSGNCIQEGLSSYNAEEMEQIAEAVKEYVPNVLLRGVKEG